MKTKTVGFLWLSIVDRDQIRRVDESMADAIGKCRETESISILDAQKNRIDVRLFDRYIFERLKVGGR